MGIFPNSPLYQFNEGNDQMNELPQDQTSYVEWYIDALQRSLHTCLTTTYTALYEWETIISQWDNFPIFPFYLSFTLYPKPV